MAESTTTTLLGILKINSTAAKTYIANKLSKKQDKLTFDTTPTANSSNPVTSSGIKTAIASMAIAEMTEAEADECIAAAGLALTNADAISY